VGEELHDGRFPETQWSLVGRAARRDPLGREALGELLLRYQPAMKSHLVRRKGIDLDRADDLLQGFIASKVIEHELVADARREKGRFRSFLLTALDRYVISEFRREGARKRQPDGSWAPQEAIESHDVPAQADAFDVDWARQVIAESLRRMEADCRRSGREDLWGLFQCRVVAPVLENAAPLPYEELIRRFGFQSPGQASNAIITAKRMFARILRSLVGEYAPTEEEVEDEIRDLRKILAAASA
jgi:RNA polymerase sigma-70 factor (ECF subfamily)